MQFCFPFQIVGKSSHSISEEDASCSLSHFTPLPSKTTAAAARVCLSALVLFGVWKLQLGIKERKKKGRKAHRLFAAAAEKVP